MVIENSLTKDELKSRLSQLNETKLEISKLTSKINKIEQEHRAIASVDGSMTEYPYSKVHYKVVAVSPKYEEEMNKYLDILSDRKVKAIENLNFLESFINKIEDSRLRLIFEYKYVDQYSWEKIAFKLGNGATADSIRKEHDRYLKKF